MSHIRLSAILASALLAGVASADAALRAPANPLVTIDPYTSCWSTTDNLYDDITRHWTGSQFPLVGVIKVDGTNYRFMGKEQPDLTLIAHR